MTEITNHEASELAPLADVADMLQGAGEDRTKARILNQPNWLPTVEGDNFLVNKYIRANGMYGRPDRTISFHETALDGGHPELVQLWDIMLDDQSKLFFRMVDDAEGRSHPTVLWAYLADDLPERVAVYDEALDAEFVGDDRQLAYNRARRYDELGHIPVYGDDGFVKLTPEGQVELGVFDSRDIEDLTVDAEHVQVYKNWSLLSSAQFGTVEAAAEWQALAYTHLRRPNPRVQAGSWMGDPFAARPTGRSAPRSEPTRRQAAALPVVKPKRQSAVKRLIRSWVND